MVHKITKLVGTAESFRARALAMGLERSIESRDYSMVSTIVETMWVSYTIHANVEDKLFKSSP
jgi:hypothetical protein